MAKPERSLDAMLETGLGAHFGRAVRIVGVRAESVDEFSTHPILRLRLALKGGETVSLILKRLQPQADREVRRELDVYRTLLANQRFGAPALYASVCDEAEGRYWLYLEDVEGWRLDWCKREVWEEAFRWLARLHCCYWGQTQELQALGCLLEHGAPFYQHLADSAQQRLFPGSPLRERFGALMAHFPQTIRFLTTQPRTLLHGDATCKNLLVQQGAAVRPRIRPLDWEWAAVGHPAWDVAWLLSGWGNHKRRLLDVYFDEVSAHTAIDRRAFTAALACCEALKALWYLRFPGERAERWLERLERIRRRLERMEVWHA